MSREWKTYFEDTGTRRDFVQLNDAHEQVCKGRRFDVAKEPVDNTGLCLYKGEHLRDMRSIYNRVCRTELKGAIHLGRLFGQKDGIHFGEKGGHGC